MDNSKIAISTRHGKCLVNKYQYKCGSEPTIQTAIDKTQYWISMVKEIHGNRYDYSKSTYIDAKTKVVISCPAHGDFNQTPDSHNRGSGCPACKIESIKVKNTSSKLDFEIKALKIHNGKYDYSKFNYTSSTDKSIIICPIHGEFIMNANIHLDGCGCQKCADEKRLEFQKNNAVGWGRKSWIKAANKSRYFDSFKVYIIRVYGYGEEFLKIGRTYNTISRRFNGKKSMPYEYELIKTIEGSAEFVFDKELELKRKYKNNKYFPKIKFNGEHECFNIEIINNIR